jgi:hypothetical protein
MFSPAAVGARPLPPRRVPAARIAVPSPTASALLLRQLAPASLAAWRPGKLNHVRLTPAGPSRCIRTHEIIKRGSYKRDRTRDGHDSRPFVRAWQPPPMTGPYRWTVGPVPCQCPVDSAWAEQVKVPHNPSPSIAPAHPGPLTSPTPPAAPVSLRYSMDVAPYPFYRVGCHIHALASHLPSQVMVRTRRRWRMWAPSQPRRCALR